jgi:uncharacterized damage-inducible protein DinB
MTHPLVTQLRFTRNEWKRALRGVSDVDARLRFEPMNSISWMVGHLAWQEHLYWIRFAKGEEIAPHLDDVAGCGKPASSPPFRDMWSDWREITSQSDDFLNELTGEMLLEKLEYKGRPVRETTGTMLQRMIYHYWFHIGEALSIRQLLGHQDLPEFVGDISGQAPYRRETAIS